MKKLFFSICIGLIFVGCSSDADQVLSESTPTLDKVEVDAAAILVKGNAGIGRSGAGAGQSRKGSTNTNTSSSYAEDNDNTMVP